MGKRFLQSRSFRIGLFAGFFLALIYLACSFSYQTSLNALWRAANFKGIAADGWVRDEALLELPKLYSSGNRLQMQFNTWRPAQAAPAQASTQLCNQNQAQFVVVAGSKVEVSLKADCNPHLLRFQVSNPFVPSEKDTRRLLGQITELRVSSRLGLPIFEPFFLLKLYLSAALLILLCASNFTVRPRRYLAAYLSLLVLAVFLARANIFDLSKLYLLWLCLTTFLCGSAVYMRLRHKLRSGAAGWSSVRRELSADDVCIFLAVVLLCLGAALRFYDLSFGLPDNYHPDEVPKVNSIMSMYNSGDLNPRYFLHPSLLLYLSYFVNSFMHFFGLFEGEFRATAFLAGRGVSAVAGSASIFLIFLIGRRLFSALLGLFAAAMLAFSPLHVTCSRYMKEDATLVFFCLGALLLVLKAVQEKKVLMLYFAAILVGLSASTKYTGMLNVAILLAAPFLRSGSLRPDPRFLKHTIFALLLVPMAFAMASPYVILNNSKFLSDFRYEKKHMLRGHTHAIDAWSQYWMFHFSHSLLGAMSYWVALLSVVACGFLARRARSFDLLLLAMVLVFYLPSEWVKAKPAPQPERYILPCVPFLILALGEFLRTLWGLRFRSAALLLGCLCLYLPLSRSLQLARDLAPDTRIQTERFIAKLPAGSKFFVDWQPYGPYLKKYGIDLDYILREGIIEKLNRRYLEESGRDYLVLSSLFYNRYFDDTVADAAVRRRFVTAFQKIPIVAEFKAPSGTYGFHNPVLTIFSLKAEDFAKLDAELEKVKSGELAHTSNQERSYFRWEE